MNSRSRFERVDELFRQAVRLGRQGASAFLDEHCADDPSIKAEVLDLLEEDARTRGELDQPAVGDELRLTEAGFAAAPEREHIPESIGHYRVIQRLGQGGMGVVYEAEQDSPRRTVALKVVNPGFLSHRAMRRFEHETDVLGRLQHPGIAQIFEAGTFDSGAGAQPYFAMELVRGEPVTAYARKRNLSTRDRLELISRICEAVHHAHQRGVIHRDLKPVNILVDESGQPKILDFGVARITDSDLQTTTLRTSMGQLIGTVPYMSPEQATGNPDELDIRSDVYALGVIAYELLADRLPYQLDDKLVHEAVRIIREDEPSPLSSTSRLLAGDIETIVQKALEKDKARRYDSAAALREDITRFLRDEPITARPPSAWYQWRKFARRNRTVVAAGGSVLLVIVTALVVVSFALAKAVDRHREAERQAMIAQEANDFLNEDLLAAVAPENALSTSVTMLDVLDVAASHIDGRFPDEPTVEASIRKTVGDTYHSLGRLEQAEHHLQRAHELLRMYAAPNDPLALNTQASLAMILHSFGRYDEAIEMLADAQTRLTKTLGAHHVDTLRADQAMGSMKHAIGELEEAASIYERVLPILREVRGNSHKDTLSAQTNLAYIYLDLGRYDETNDLLLRTLESSRDALGEDHWDTVNCVLNLAELRRIQGEYDEAESLLLDAQARYERRGAPEAHPRMLTLINNLALVYLYQGRYDEAEPMYERVIEIGSQVEGAEHPNTLTSMNNLAGVYLMTERYEQAEELFARTLELRRAVMGPTHAETLMTQSNLGRALWRQGRFEPAAELMISAYDVMAETLGTSHPVTVATAEYLAELHHDWGRMDDARRWLSIARGTAEDGPG